jgi:ribosomal protein S27E
MATFECPCCGARVASPEGWAKAALAVLVPAPAVPGMATRLRCPQCQAVFSQPEGRSADTWRGLLPVAVLIAVLLALAFLVPG